jgi:hypothetical protein
MVGNIVGLVTLAFFCWERCACFLFIFLFFVFVFQKVFETNERQRFLKW